MAQALQAAKTKLEPGPRTTPRAAGGRRSRLPISRGDGCGRFWDLLAQGGCPIRANARRSVERGVAAPAVDKEPGKITANQGAFLDEMSISGTRRFSGSRRAKRRRSTHNNDCC